MRISICILTCNRCDTVLDLLRDLGRQTLREHLEVVVVDNGSVDGSAAAIRAAHPDVELVVLPTNIGCSARNEGIRRAHGDVLVMLDDDVFLHRAEECERICAVLEANPQADVVSFKILFESDRAIIPFNWFHPRPYQTAAEQTFETDYISEGAVVFRRHVFDRVGYYPEDFFISHEGPDLACRIIDADMTMLYSGDVEVLHRCEARQRTTWRNTYYDTRNYIWLGIRRFPWGVAAGRVPTRLVLGLLFAVSRGQLVWFARGVLDGLRGAPNALAERRPMGRGTIKRIRGIRAGKGSFLRRLLEFARRVRSFNERGENTRV